MDVVSETLDHFFVKKAHTRRHVADIFPACSKPDSRRDDLAADHPGIHRLALGFETGADNNVAVCLLHLPDHGFNVPWIVLAVAVQLQDIIITVVIGVTHPAFDRSGKSRIHRKIHKIEMPSGTDLPGVVRGPVVDDHIIILRIVFC